MDFPELLNRSEGEREGLPEESKPLTLLLSLIPLAAIFGNTLVVVAVFKERSLQNLTNTLIVSLAISDFLVAVCVMSFAVYFQLNSLIWDLGPFICHLYMAMDVIASTASILNLFAISVDRYIAVVYPYAYAEYRVNDRGHTKWYVAVVWAISIAVGMPLLFGVNKLSDSQITCEFTNPYFIIISSMFSFFIPGVAITILYAVIFQRLWQRIKARSPANQNQDSIKIDSINLTGDRRFAKHAATISSYENGFDSYGSAPQVVSLPTLSYSSSEPSTTISSSTCETCIGAIINKEKRSRNSRKYFTRQDSLRSIVRNVSGTNTRNLFNISRQAKHEQKATVTLAVVLAAFLGCWIPFFSLHLRNALCILSSGTSCVHFRAFFFATWLGYLNSSLNPLIYTIFDQRFRRAFRRLLCKHA